MKMETCMQVKTGMFLQTGQSCWCRMARICSTCTDGTYRWHSVLRYREEVVKTVFKATCIHDTRKKQATIKALAIYNHFKLKFIALLMNKTTSCQLPPKYQFFCSISCAQTGFTGVLFCNELWCWTEAKTGSDYGEGADADWKCVMLRRKYHTIEPQLVWE